MLVEKKNVKKAVKLLESFSNNKHIKRIGNRTVAPRYVVKYIKEQLEKEIPKKVYKTDYATYYLEQIDNYIYISRIVDDVKRTVLLNKEDLRLIKDINNISKNDIKKLADKIDNVEKRFGL
jgi:hypothetical protein